MDIVALIAAVIAATQVVKQVIKIDPNIIAVVLSILAVAYKAVETGAAWNLGLIVILVQVIIGAVGTFKVAKQFADASNSAKSGY